MMYIVGYDKAALQRLGPQTGHLTTSIRILAETQQANVGHGGSGHQNTIPNSHPIGKEFSGFRPGSPTSAASSTGRSTGSPARCVGPERRAAPTARRDGTQFQATPGSRRRCPPLRHRNSLWPVSCRRSGPYDVIWEWVRP